MSPFDRPPPADLIQALGLADEAALEDLAVLTRVASLVTGAPNAFVSFADATHLWNAAGGGRQPLEDSYCACMLSGEADTLVARDVRQDARTCDIAARKLGSPIVTYAGALLRAGDGSKLGTLCVTDEVERALDDEQIWLLKGLARQAMNLVSLRAAKRELTEALAQMTRLATLDSLTGLLNRRAFQEEAETLRGLAQRQGGALCVAMIDIDHFKRINDGHGHAAGDAVLGEVSRWLQSQLRASDRIGRIGGEEFAIALPFTRLEAAVQLIDRLRAWIAMHPVSHDGELLPVTISGGVAELRADEASVEAAIRRADDALYRAKRAGRDRIRIAASLPAKEAVTPESGNQSRCHSPG